MGAGGQQQQQSHISTARRSRLLMTFLAGIALVVLLFAGGGGSKDGGKSVDSGSTTSPPAVLATSSSSSSSSSPRVPVTIFVMSRCPDAQFCETFLQSSVLEPLKGAVRLRAEYIVREEEATAGTTATATKKLTCMHGEQECAGNRQQLCLQKRLDDRIAAGKLSADATVDVLLKFLTCGWRRPSEIGSEAGARSCLSEVGWANAEDQDDVLSCAKGAEGEALMAASHAATQAAGATNSCTINVNGKRRCVRDGGAFRECEGGSEPADFKKTICAALTAGGGTAAACK
jgi:hypothetical protein